MLKKIVLLLLLSYHTFSQSFLPSFHGVHNINKIPANGQVAYFNFSSGESGYTLSGATSTSDKNENANNAVELDDATDRITGHLQDQKVLIKISDKMTIIIN